MVVLMWMWIRSEARTAPRGIIYRSMNMLKWALIFLLISVVAGFLGFTGVAVGAAEIAKVLFFLFVALFLIFLVVGLLAAQRLK